MAKQKAGDHSQLAAYPDDPRPAIDLLLGHLSGGGDAPESKDVIHAGWHLAGYAAGKFDPHVAQAQGCGPDEKCDKEQLKAHLECLRDECDGKPVKAAIPWALLIQAVLDLIQQLLKPQPQPGPAPTP